jgi:hypothetical protein
VALKLVVHPSRERVIKKAMLAVCKLNPAVRRLNKQALTSPPQAEINQARPQGQGVKKVVPPSLKRQEPREQARQARARGNRLKEIN